MEKAQEIVKKLIEIADKEAEITEQLSLINMHDLIDWHMFEFKQDMVPLLEELSSMLHQVEGRESA